MADMAELGAFAHHEGPTDGSESLILNPMRAVYELGAEAFEETGVSLGVSLLQSPEERAEWLADEAARIDAAARRGRGPRFRRDPGDAEPQFIGPVEGEPAATLVGEGVAVAAMEGELPTVVPERDFVTWARDQVRAVRAAGKQGTWKGRRDVDGRSFADREKPPFIGRYNGPCRVTPQMLNVEYGGLDPDPALVKHSLY